MSTLVEAVLWVVESAVEAATALMAIAATLVALGAIQRRWGDGAAVPVAMPTTAPESSAHGDDEPITWVATVTTSSTSVCTTDTAPPQTQEMEATDDHHQTPPPVEQPLAPLVTPYNPTAYSSTLQRKAETNDANNHQQQKSDEQEPTHTKTSNKRRQRRHNKCATKVREDEGASGFPQVDDEVLEGAEEGLDPKGPLRLQKCARFGRYLAAARPLSAGEKVICEGAALWGPRADASAPACTRCLRPLPRPPPLCAQCCAAPLCHRCLHAQAPFGEAECAWLRTREGPPPDLCRPRVALCVRALMMRRSGDRRWGRIERLEAHEEARRGTEAWQETRAHLVEPLRAAGLLSPDEDEVLLQRISGIMDVNTFEVRGGCEGAVAEGQGRALFPSAALLAHDCLPSAHVAVDEQQVMHVRTARALAPGEPLTLSYAAPLQATAERQEHLLQGKYFACACRRCRDPEECGTRLGGVRCPKCRKGDLLPPSLPQTGWWECRAAARGSGCGHRAPPQLIATTHARARDLVEEASSAGDARQMEALLSRLRRSLPFHSAPALTLVQELMAHYRSRLQSELRPPTALLQRQATLARELLAVVSLLAPGDPRMAAVAHYELHGALAALAQRKHAAEGGGALAEGLREAEKELSAAAAALLLEPPHSPEGRLGRAAVAQIRSLREDILHAEAEAAEQAAARAEADRRRQQRRGQAAPARAPTPTAPTDEEAKKKKKKRRRGKQQQQQPRV